MTETTRHQDEVIDAMASRCDSVAVTVEDDGTVRVRCIVNSRTVMRASIAPDGTTSAAPSAAAEWHARIRSAPNFAAAQDLMGEALAAGVDFAELNALATA